MNTKMIKFLIFNLEETKILDIRNNIKKTNSVMILKIYIILTKTSQINSELNVATQYTNNKQL